MDFNETASGFIDKKYGFTRLYWNDVLPKRYIHSQPSNTKLANKYDYRKEYTKYCYAIKNAFNQAFYDGKNRKYDIEKLEKCFVIIVNFHEKNVSKDSDNFETKPISDLVTKYFLKNDDCYKNCQYVSLTKKGKTSHTEIFIVPFDEILNFASIFFSDWEP